MPIKSSSYLRCRCDIPPTARLPCKSSRDRSDFQHRIASAERKRKIPDLYGKYGKIWFHKKRIGRTKCALCMAAAIAAVYKDRRADYRRPKNDAKKTKRALADDSGHEDRAVEVPRDVACQTLRTAVNEEATLQDLSNEEESEEEGFNDEVYESEDTIRRVTYSDYNPNESYDEEAQENSSPDSPDSNDEAINHDDQRWPPPMITEPSSQAPSGCSETLSSASESQSSAYGDDEYDGDEETRERERMREKERRKERKFRDKADEKYLRSLSRRG